MIVVVPIGAVVWTWDSRTVEAYYNVMDFDERAFDTMALGDDRSVAAAKVGRPMYIECFPSGVESWGFTMRATGAEAWPDRTLVFSSAGKLIEKRDEIIEEEPPSVGEVVFLQTSLQPPLSACASLIDAGIPR